MKLVNLALDPSDYDDADMTSSSLLGGEKKPKGPVYPSGLGFSLNDDCLEKLGIATPKPGDTVMLMVKATVKSVSTYADDDGEKDGETTDTNVYLQITDAGVPDAQAKSTADVLYKK
jgi:hypothetical protein